MRYLFFLLILLSWGTGYSQGSGFSFSYNGPTQIVVGDDCLEALNWGHPNTPTAHSNIPGGVIVSFDIYSISPDYEIDDLVPGGTTVTVFYQAVDNFGNSALYGFTISFIDQTPPVFDPLSLPPNLTISCSNQVPPPADIEVSDNCENENTNLTVTFTETNNAVPCAGGSIIRTWVADDDLGNYSTFTQTITVTPDVIPPVIMNNLQNGMAPCSTAMAQYTLWLNTQRANFTATDNGCGLMSLTDNAPNPAIITSFCGVIDVTFTATDNCGNISTVIKTFTVFNAVAPVITTPATGAEGDCSQSNIAQVFNAWINNHGGAEATDDCSSIFWSTYPPNPTVGDTCNTAIEVLFIAGDGCNNFDTTAASFTLTDNTPPVITSVPSTIILGCHLMTIDSLLQDWLMNRGFSNASDLCTSNADLRTGFRIGGNALTLEEVLEAWEDSLVSGCHDNVIIGGIGINNVKAYLPVEFTYTDKCDNETGKIGYFGITDNGRPIFETNPVDTSFACAQGGSWEDGFLAWYNSAGAATYTDLCSEVTVHASMTADSAIQILAAALDTACLQGVSVTISFSLTDECGNNSLMMPSGTFSIQDTVAPVLVTPAMDALLPCSDNVQLQLETWIDTLAGAEASDGCGTLAWEFSWVDTAGMIQVGVPGIGPYPSLLDLDCSSGIEIVFEGFDICQNSVTDTAVFSVIDTLPPMITLSADSVHLECQDTIPGDLPLVTDECDSEPLITYTDSVSMDSCLGIPLIVIRTWTAMDDCGNASSAMQWFFRIDTIPPTFDLPPDTLAFCGGDSLSLLNVLDNCDPDPVITFEDMLTGIACNQTLNRIWTVTDACGNFTTAEQIFNLTDDTAPEIIVSPGNFIYACDTSSLDLQSEYEQWMNAVQIEDGCSAADYFIAVAGSYMLDDTTTWPGTPIPDSIMAMCGINLLIEADLVAYDACGNAVVEAISFSVMDTISPIFIDCPDELILQPDMNDCQATVTLMHPDFIEICFPEEVVIQLIINHGDSIVVSPLASIDTILPVGMHNIEWLAIDCNGNVGSCNTTVRVVDINALSIQCPSDTLLYTSPETCVTVLSLFTPETTTGDCSQGSIKWNGYVEGMANPSAFTFDSADQEVIVEFNVGMHNVFFIAIDSIGNTDTCRFMVEVRDTISPAVHCQNDTIFLQPSGLEDIDVSSTGLLLSAEDACGIDTIMYDPPTVNCSNNGDSVPITITATDENGNTSECQAILVVNTLPLMPYSESQLCDDTLRLFANLPDGSDTIYTFSWTGPDMFVSTDQNPIIPASDTTNSGTYVLTIESENGCITTGSVEVIVQELVAPVLLVAPDTLCAGEQVTITTQSFSGDVNYQWFVELPAGDTLEANTDVPEYFFIPAVAGTYRVFGILSQDTCTSAPGIPVEFFVVSVPEANIAGDSLILCVDDTLYLVPNIVFDSLQYAWTGPNGYESFEATPPGIPASEIDTSATYTLTVSNAFCSSRADSLFVLIQPPLPLPMITGDTFACEGGTIVLTTMSSHSSYEWIDPLGNSIITDTDSLSVAPVGMDQSGDWKVIAYENGCASDTSAAFTIIIDTAIQILIEPVPVVCEGDSITLSFSPVISGDYFWSGPDAFSSMDLSPTLLAQTGTYSVSLMSDTGCNAVDSTDIMVDDLPVITSLVSDATDCVNGIDAVTIWAITQPDFSPDYMYDWNGPSDFILQDSSIRIDSATAFMSGVYSLVITNGVCVSDTAMISIDLTDTPDMPIISGDNQYCYGDSIFLFIDSPVVGGIYSWTSSDTNAIIVSPGTLVIPNATPGWNGAYTVDLTIDGCTSVSSSIAVQVSSELFAPSITTAPQICEGDSLVLISTAPAGSMSNWISSNGFDSNEDQPVIFPVQLEDAGTYQLIYSLNGCPSPPSNPFDIEVLPSPSPPSGTADISSVCIDQAVPIELCIEQNSIISGGTYSWQLNGTGIIGGPTADSCITINSGLLHAGVNSISAIVSIQGCRSVPGQEVLINGDEIPKQTADAGPDITICPGEQVILNGSDPSPGTGFWLSDDALVIFSDPTDPMADIIGLPSGTYTLAWTLSYASCLDYSEDSSVINVLSSPLAFPDTVEVPFGLTTEFNVVSNDLIYSGGYTIQIVSSTQKGNVLPIGNGSFRYSPNVGFVGTDRMIYRICSVECPDECSETEVVLKVGNEDDCFVPTLITPNNDGVNDLLVVPCLETDRYPNNKITVFNQWGNIVFSASPYANDWDGTHDGTSLPVSTYFYIMDFGDGSTPKKTFLILER